MNTLLCNPTILRLDITPKSYHNLSARVSGWISLVFGLIIVKKKSNWAHTTFNLVYSLVIPNLELQLLPFIKVIFLNFTKLYSRSAKSPDFEATMIN